MLSLLASSASAISEDSESCPTSLQMALHGDRVLLPPEWKVCLPTAFPSNNNHLSLSGQRLNTHFAWWRKNQSKASSLQLAYVITFFGKQCPFSQALLPMMAEVAMHYSDESIQFVKADIAESSYADLTRMGVSSTPVVRLHTQDKRLTYSGDFTLSALTKYITNNTGLATLPMQQPGHPAFDLQKTPFTQAPQQVATASHDKMQSLVTAPLTLIADAIVVFALAECLCKKIYIQRMWKWSSLKMGQLSGRIETSE